jgi:hypothetical protein
MKTFAIAAAVWLLFTLLYFRVELLGGKGKAQATPATPAADSEVFGSVRPLVVPAAIEVKVSPAVEEASEDEKSDGDDEVEYNILEDAFDVEFGSEDAPDVEDEGDDEDGDEEDGAAQVEAPTRTIEEMQAAVRVAKVEVAESDTATRREAAETLRDVKDTDLFSRLSQLPLGERMELLMQEFEREWDRDYERVQPAADVDYAALEKFDIHDFA